MGSPDRSVISVTADLRISNFVSAERMERVLSFTLTTMPTMPLLVTIFYSKKTTDIDEINSLKG